jgi:Outer membrane protein beta-barrel domain
MKKVNLLLSALIILFSSIISAQSDDQIKLDNLKYYLASIKDYNLSMRYYTDSVKIINLLDQMDVITASLEEELNSIVIPDTIVEQTFSDTIVPEEENKIEMPEDFTWTDTEVKHENENESGIGLSKYMPFKKKFNTNFKIEFGINSLHQITDAPAGVLSPEINTSGSWYWDFGLTRRARLGGKDSKVAINYGISFLKNRFKIENDLRLTTNADKNPEFVAVPDAKNNPKLNVGYLNIPLSLNFSLSKKTKLELGGYAGYRIHTVQKFHLKTSGETIHENRYAGYNLNNWIYGATAGLDISGFDLIVRYNFSKLFKDNPNYDFNTFMIGTSVSLF